MYQGIHDNDPFSNHFNHNINKMLLRTYNYNVFIMVVMCILAISTKLQHRIDPSINTTIDRGSAGILMMMFLYQFNPSCVTHAFTRRLIIAVYCWVCYVARKNSKTSLYWWLLGSFAVYLYWTQMYNIRAKTMQSEFNQICYGNFEGLSRVMSHQCQTSANDNYTSQSMTKLRLLKLLLKLDIDTIHLETIRTMPSVDILDIVHRRMNLYNITPFVLNNKSFTFLNRLMAFIDQYPSMRKKLIPQRTSKMSEEYLFVLIHSIQFNVLSPASLDGYWDKNWIKTFHLGKIRIAIKMLFDIDGDDTNDTNSIIDTVNRALQQWNITLDIIKTVGCLNFIYIVGARALKINIAEKVLFNMEQRSIMAMFHYFDQKEINQTTPHPPMNCFNIHQTLGTKFSKTYDDMYKSMEGVRKRLQSSLNNDTDNKNDDNGDNKYNPIPIEPTYTASIKNGVLEKSTRNPQIGGLSNTDADVITNKELIKQINVDIDLSPVQKSILTSAVQQGLPILTPLTDDNLSQMHKTNMQQKYKNIVKNPELLHDMDPYIIELIHRVRRLGIVIEGEAIVGMGVKRFLSYVQYLLETHSRPYTIDDLIGENYDKILHQEQNNVFIDIDNVRNSTFDEIQQKTQWKKQNKTLTQEMYKAIQAIQACNDTIDTEQLVGLKHCSLVVLHLGCRIGVDAMVAINSIHVKGKLELLMALVESGYTSLPRFVWDDVDVASNEYIFNILRTHIVKVHGLNNNVKKFTEFVNARKSSLKSNVEMLTLLYRHSILCVIVVRHILQNSLWILVANDAVHDDAQDQNKPINTSAPFKRKCYQDAVMTFLKIMLQYIIDASQEINTNSRMPNDGNSIPTTLLQQSKDLMTNAHRHPNLLDDILALLEESMYRTKMMIATSLALPKPIIDIIKLNPIDQMINTIQHWNNTVTIPPPHTSIPTSTPSTSLIAEGVSSPSTRNTDETTYQDILISSTPTPIAKYTTVEDQYRFIVDSV